MSQSYLTDLNHFLDENGQIPKEIPKEARDLASFLILIVDYVTSEFPVTDFGIETGIRCRADNCKGTIIGALQAPDEAIEWYCLECGRNGFISNWQRSKWDNT